VVSMPIAGSSAGWAQQSNADLSVSLGLVLMSTLLSPVTTPLALRSVGLMAEDAYAAQLDQIAGQGTASFLTMWVLLPSCLGIFGRLLLGETRVHRVSGLLKMANVMCLFVLCYSNAAICLPQVIQQPDWDFLIFALAIVSGLCTLAFASGAVIGRCFRADRPQRVALMFGLGMNNNGTGLVIASLTMGSNPVVMMPIILYNLVQHLAASFVSAMTARYPSPFLQSIQVVLNVDEGSPDLSRSILTPGVGSSPG
jgi:BASS family bile acid:Na+ symporter